MAKLIPFPTRVAPSLYTEKHHEAKHISFYEDWNSVAKKTQLNEALYAFDKGFSVLVLPTTRAFGYPARPQMNTEWYWQYLYKQDDWFEEDGIVTSEERKAIRSGSLTAKLRHRIETPLLRIITHVVEEHFSPGHRALSNPIGSVRLYVFKNPNTVAIPAKAPANAAGPYELCTFDDESSFYLAYWDSMTNAQRQEYNDKVV